MTEPKWSESFADGQKKYQVINMIAKRARQINGGERPAVPAEGLSPQDAAVSELRADKIRWIEMEEAEASEE